MGGGGARGGDQAGIGRRDRRAGEPAAECGAIAYDRATMELHPRYGASAVAKSAGDTTSSNSRFFECEISRWRMFGGW